MGTQDWLGIGLGAADIIGNQINAAVQYGRTKKLMDIQQQNQMKLNQQGQELQMKTWEQTNYPRQVEMLKEAGLNPGLLYSKGGTGGTTGSQGGGSAAMGSAQQAQPFDLANMLMMKKIQADIENVKADTAKKDAETGVIGATGVKEAESRIGKMIAETSNEALKGELIKVQTANQAIKNANEQSVIDANLKNVGEHTRQLELQNMITKETANSVIKEAAANATGAILENELRESKISLTDEQKNAIVTGITQKWAEISQGGQKIDQEAERILIEKFKANVAAENPAMGQVAGNVLKKAYQSLKNVEHILRGEDTEPLKQTIK